MTPPEAGGTKWPRLTWFGSSVLVLGAVLFLVGLLYASTPFLEAGLVMLMFPCIAILVSRANLAMTDGSAVMPGSVFKSLEFDVEICLSNRKRVLGSSDVRLIDDTLFRRIFFPWVDAVSRCRTAVISRMQKRGVYKAFPFRLVSYFPLGLVCHERAGVLHHRLVVHPYPRLPPDMREILENGMGLSGYWHTKTSDVTGEFRSTRDYEPGDHMKLVSWPLSERLQKLVVRETEQPGLRRCLVVFHSYQPPWSLLSGRTFEKSLELLSGLFAFFQENVIPFDFVASFNDWKKVSASPNEASAREAFDLLAGAQMVASKDLQELSQVLNGVSSGTEGVVIVSNTPTRLWTHMLPQCYVPVFCVDTNDAGVFMPRGMSS